MPEILAIQQIFGEGEEGKMTKEGRGYFEEGKREEKKMAKRERGERERVRGKRWASRGEKS
jgi:hypothetical protein